MSFCTDILRHSLLSLLAIAAPGCVLEGATEDDLTSDTELTLGSTSDALTAPVDWHQDGARRFLMPQSDGFCFLTRITGHFAGYGERVRISTADGWWTLEGASQQLGVAATARCATWYELNANWRKSISAEDFPATTFSTDGFGGPIQYGLPTPLWDYRSFCFLSGVEGAFWGSGERVRIVPQEPGWTLDVDNFTFGGEATGTRAYSRCVHLGQQGNIAYVGGNVAQVHEYRWEMGWQPVPMASTSDAFCFLTGMEGEFAGGGEYVEIVDNAGTWTLQGAGVGDRRIKAYARCVARRQAGLKPSFVGRFGSVASPGSSQPCAACTRALE